MRAIFLCMVLANLVFFAWARFIDVPPAPAPNDRLGSLPRLQLLRKVRQHRSSASSAGTYRPAEPSAPAVAPSTNAATLSAPAPTAQRTSGGAGGPITARVQTSRMAPIADPQRCVSLGPFADPARAGRASALLARYGFKPRSRVERDVSPPGYSVFVAGLRSRAAAERALHRLQGHGLTSAQLTPRQGARGLTLSVGLFAQRGNAQQRQLAVRRLGLDARIAAERPSARVQWLDVTLGAGGPKLSLADVLSLERSDRAIEVEACRASAAQALPDATAGTVAIARRLRDHGSGVRAGLAQR